MKAFSLEKENGKSVFLPVDPSLANVGARYFFIGIYLVDAVVIKDAVKMIDFVLKDDGVVASSDDGDVFFSFCFICLNGDLEVADDVAWMAFINGQAAFSGIDVGFAHGGGGDLWVYELIFGLALDLSVLVVVWIRDDEHF